MFDDYLDLLDWFKKLLEQADLIEHMQLASFHPRYQFEGVLADDLSQFTNRACHPIIHILRQPYLSRALTHFAEPKEIYAENIKTSNKLGRQKVEALCPGGNRKIFGNCETYQNAALRALIVQLGAARLIFKSNSVPRPKKNYFCISRVNSKK